MHDVVVVGGGFAGVTAAARRQGTVVVRRCGRGAPGWAAAPELHPGTATRSSTAAAGRTGTSHTRSEITRAGLTVELSSEPDVTAWYVGDERRTGTIAERDAIVNSGGCSPWTGSSGRCRIRTTPCS